MVLCASSALYQMPNGILFPPELS